MSQALITALRSQLAAKNQVIGALQHNVQALEEEVSLLLLLEDPGKGSADAVEQAGPSLKRPRQEEPSQDPAGKKVKPCSDVRVALEWEPDTLNSRGLVEFKAVKLRGERLGFLPLYQVEEKWLVRRADAEKIFSRVLVRPVERYLFGGSSWNGFSQWCSCRGHHCRTTTIFLPVAALLPALNDPAGKSAELSDEQMGFVAQLKCLV